MIIEQNGATKLYGYTVKILGRTVCAHFAAFETREQAKEAAIDDLLDTLDQLNKDPDKDD